MLNRLLIPHRKLKTHVLTFLLCVTSPVVTGNKTILSEIKPLDCVIQPSELIEVGSAESGIIENIYFDRSQHVKKGDHLVQLDARVERMDTHLAAKKASTKTAVELRDSIVKLGYKTRNRTTDLLNDNLIPKQEIDKIDNDIRIAELNLKLEKENREIAEINYERALAILDRRSIVSQVDGVVLKRYKSVGERVNDDPILRIAKLDPLHVEAVLPMRYLHSIKMGMTATVSATNSAAAQKATVTVIDQVMDAASGTFGVRLSMQNPDYTIPAGVLCQVSFDNER